MNIGRIVGVIAAILLLIGAAVFFFFRYSFSAEGMYRVKNALGVSAAPPERHIVPGDFQGWAILHFAVEDAPPLKADGDSLVVEYPASGRLETSTPAHDDEGFLHREYFRRTPDGLVPLSRMGEIWGEYNMRTVRDEAGSMISRSAGFYVGTMEEFRQAERPLPGLELPKLSDSKSAAGSDRAITTEGRTESTE
jgi:hypothetical protein